ncbi:MAG: response regulator [Ferruginibacter sp.]
MFLRYRLMLVNIFRRIKKLYGTVSNIGMTDELDIEYAQRLRLTNLFGFFPIFIYLFFIWFGLSQDYSYPAIISIVLLIFTIFGFYLNYRGKYVAAKMVIFGTCSMSVFVTYNVLNIDYSILSYFFPIMMAYEIAYDIKKEFRAFLFSFSLTLLFLAACFLVPKYFFYGYQMSDEILRTSIILNFVFPFALSVIFMFTIISIHYKTHEKLVKAREESEKANRAKSAFLSNMSHELRTPLNGIIGATNLLMHEQATQSQKKYYYVLQHTSNHMLHLINHILDFSKIKEGKINLDRNIFNVKDLVNTLCNVYKVQNTNGDVIFNANVDEALNCDVISDDLRLKQILYNLLSNAFKFTKRGNVNLVAELVKKSDNKLTIRFTVKDSGIGISEDKLHKVFESFEQADKSTTREFGGTGLGLPISKQLAGLFGSELYVSSTPGKGSSFTFEITAEQHEEKAAAVQPADEGLQKLSGMKILVAEDNKINMMVLKTFLKKWDVSPMEAVNGAEALAKYRTEKFDVVLMDLEMPEMDGYTALKEIRKHDHTIPIIAFTAALYDGMEQDLKVKGFNSYLHKPFNPADLYNKIVQYKRSA